MTKLTQTDIKSLRSRELAQDLKGPMDLTHCAECGCSGEMYIHSRCHVSAGTYAVLHHAEPRSGAHDLLRLECAECRKVIAYFTIAGGPYGEKPQ